MERRQIPLIINKPYRTPHLSKMTKSPLPEGLLSCENKILSLFSIWNMVLIILPSLEFGAATYIKNNPMNWKEDKFP